MIYIDAFIKENNAFAEWGKLGHSLLERYYKGEMDFFDLSGAYEKEYKENIIHNFPPNAYVNLNETYYRAGKEYFNSFKDSFGGYEVIGVEEEMNIRIGSYDFIGYIDLILRGNDGLVVVDHKSKSKFKNKKEKSEYLRQLYLYSVYIHHKYGEYPKKLIFNMFRVNEIIIENFDIKALREAKKWCFDTIAEIYRDMNFIAKQNDFFCNWLCNTRRQCICSDNIDNDWSDDSA